MEETKNEENEAAENGGLPSRVQELEGELKDSKRKNWDLIHANTALQNILKATREEKDQEVASLQEKLLSIQRSQVRRMVSLRHQSDHQECYVRIYV